jgi:hypothetical protein
MDEGDRFRAEGAELDGDLLTARTIRPKPSAPYRSTATAASRGPDAAPRRRANTDSTRRSLLIGDKPSDLQAARAAGVPHRVLVGTDGRSVPLAVFPGTRARDRALPFARRRSECARTSAKLERLRLSR